MLRALQAFRVDLVDALGAGRPCGKPAAGGDDLDPADARAIAGRFGQHRINFLTGERGTLDLLTGELRQGLTLRRIGGRIDPFVGRVTEFLGEISINPGRVLAGPGSNLTGEQRERDAILVGGPYAAVAAQQRGTRALLAG